MRIVELDASGWETISDYCKALRRAIQAPEGHGCSIDAFLDSMIWGGMSTISPPYTVRVRNLAKAPTPIVDEVKLLKRSLEEARTERLEQRGQDVNVQLEISS